jgi:L-threonate 2-dehydrogenase
MSHSPVAFVGLGAMGSAMAAKLLAHQYRVVGFDIRPEAVQRFATAGGTGAASVAAACQGAGTLIVMTVNADQADAVLFEQGGVAALAKDATVIVMATCAPARVQQMAERVQQTGRRFIDAPVSGGVAGAEAGTLTIMAAAPQSTYTAAAPLLRAMGSNLYHLGEAAGQGASMKVVNQLLCGVHIAVAAEGLAFAERSGIDPKLALELLSGSAASSWMLKNRGPRMVNDDPTVTSAVDIFVKDLGLVLDTARASKFPLPLASTAHQMFMQASTAGYAREQDCAVIKIFPGIQLPGADR